MFKVIFLVVLALFVLGLLLCGALWLLTALFHAFKREELPGEHDADWSRDQAKEAGRT